MKESLRLLDEAFDLAYKGFYEKAQQRLDDYALVRYSEGMSAEEVYRLEKRAKHIQGIIDFENLKRTQ